MAGQIKVNQLQLGDSLTATQNFVWQTNVDGTAKLARGNVGATTQDILTVDAAGAVTMAAGQLKFPAVQNPSADVNTLDDYEEGTWTPAFALAVPGTSSFTYSVQVGTYTKIGRQVTVVCHITLSASSIGTGSGAIAITGLPFVNGASANYSAGGVGYAAGFSGAWPNTAMVPTSSNVLSLYILQPGASTAQLVATNVGAGVDLYCWATYFTA